MLCLKVSSCIDYWQMLILRNSSVKCNNLIKMSLCILPLLWTFMIRNFWINVLLTILTNKMDVLLRENVTVTQMYFWNKLQRVLRQWWACNWWVIVLFSGNDKVIVLTVPSVPPPSPPCSSCRTQFLFIGGNKLIQCCVNRFSFVYICSWILVNASVIMDDSMFLLVIKGGCYLLCV